jgi:hypothetical protein
MTQMDQTIRLVRRAWHDFCTPIVLAGDEPAAADGAEGAATTPETSGTRRFPEPALVPKPCGLGDGACRRLATTIIGSGPGRAFGTERNIS